MSDDLSAFYQVVDDLLRRQGGPTFAELDGRMPWPKRGVYFVFEPGEQRGQAANAPRVVRVGTHAITAGSRTTLWHRLHQHRGGQNGGGNHRGSVFRKHVGRAIIARDGLQDQYPRWNEGSSAARDVVQSEFELEQQVTRFIGDMGVAWIAVPDEPDPRSDRHLIEQSSIALLASKGHAADPSSAAWLGRHAPAAAIRASGLWNVRHVGETPRLEFFDRLEAHAAATP